MPRSYMYCSMNSPVASAFASSIAPYNSFISCRTVVARPATWICCGPMPMAQLVRQNVREESVEAQFAQLGLRQHPRRYGPQIAFELRLLDVFQHHPLAALLGHHAFVIGQ